MAPNIVRHNPKVTVLMPVFNGEHYLAEAITSILNQTFTDFELLIINDGSTDSSDSIIRSFSDHRIRYVEIGRNCGLVSTLNKGLDIAQGTFVARMDCDDVSLPRRLEAQVSFMEKHPEVGVCGTWYREVRGRISTVMRCAEDHQSIRCGSLFNPVVGHPTVMLRKEMFDRCNLRYDPAFAHAEDYRLWSECLNHFSFANIGTILMSYRVHPLQITQSKLADQMKSAGRVRRTLLSQLGLEPSDKEFQIHQFISALGRAYSNSFCTLPVSEQLDKIDLWLCKLKNANAFSGTYPEPLFSKILVERWLGVIVLQYFSQGKICTKLMRVPKIMETTPGGKQIAGDFIKKHMSFSFFDILDNLRLSR